MTLHNFILFEMIQTNFILLSALYILAARMTNLMNEYIWNLLMYKIARLFI